MKKFLSAFFFSKRQRFVISILILSFGLFASEFIPGFYLIFFSVALSILTGLFLYFSVREDLKDNFSYPIFILPILYTLSFALFYTLLPGRFITRIIITALYGFGLYSLFLTQNIFAVSAIRTINLLRSARIVSFVITIIVVFLSSNIIFSLRLPFYVSPIVIFFIVFFLNFQSLWTYIANTSLLSETLLLSLLISLCLAELSAVLNLWPVNASIYSIFISGIFYAYSGLTHAWAEKRLFKGVLWEYVWVGFLAVLILTVFSNWGI